MVGRVLTIRRTMEFFVTEVPALGSVIDDVSGGDGGTRFALARAT